MIWIPNDRQHWAEGLEGYGLTQCLQGWIGFNTGWQWTGGPASAWSKVGAADGPTSEEWASGRTPHYPIAARRDDCIRPNVNWHLSQNTGTKKRKKQKTKIEKGKTKKKNKKRSKYLEERPREAGEVGRRGMWDGQIGWREKKTKLFRVGWG